MDTEEKILNEGGLTITAAVPKGWQAQKMGTTMIYRASTGLGGLYKTMLRVGSTCQGDCGSVAKNLDAAAKEQVSRHRAEGSFKDVEVAREDSGDGEWVFQLDFEAKGKPAHQIDRYLFRDGWPQAAMASIMVYGDDVDRLGELEALCKAMKAEPAG